MEKYNSGDLMLLTKENETDIELLEIAPRCDRSFDTSILISMFTEHGYWGNFDKDEIDIIGSDISKVKVVSLEGRAYLETAISECLSWMSEGQYVSKIDVIVKITNSNAYGIELNIINKNGDIKNKYWEYRV